MNLDELKMLIEECVFDKSVLQCVSAKVWELLVSRRNAVYTTCRSKLILGEIKERAKTFRCNGISEFMKKKFLRATLGPAEL